MKLIIGGWPGAGSSTLGLILASQLKVPYLYAGGVLKHLATQIVGDQGGAEILEFESKYGDVWDKLWETYVQSKLNAAGDLLLDAKTAGFLYDAPELIKIMIKASVEARALRATGDGRANAAAVIAARDVDVRSRWVEKLGIDIYDDSLINAKFDLVMDTSNVRIEEEIVMVCKFLRTQELPDYGVIDQLELNASELTKTFWDKGKDHFRNILRLEGMLIEPAQVLVEWTQMFPELVQILPAEFQHEVRAVR